MGLSITTDEKGVKVFKNKREWSGGSFYTYSLGVSSKDKDGAWISGSIDCQFKKGIEVKNKSVIKIKSAFPVVSQSNGKKYKKIMIMDFEVIEDGEEEAKMENDGFLEIPDGIDAELPFC